MRVALDYLLDVRKRRHEGMRLAPFFAEVQGARWVDQAVAEMRAARERWARGEHLGSLPTRNSARRRSEN